jgi:ribosomal protein S27AE
MVLKSLAVAILMGIVAFFVCLLLGLANGVGVILAFLLSFFSWWFYELYQGSKEQGKTKLRMKCKNCGHWNRFEVEKVMTEQIVSEPKVKAFIPMYLPFKTETCSKCGQTIAESKELIRTMKE